MDEMHVTSTLVVDEFTQDPSIELDFNELVLPQRVWNRLLHTYRAARDARYHRGRMLQCFHLYMTGVAHALELDVNVLCERVKEVA